MVGWNHDNANWVPKECKFCGDVFTPHSGVHKFCSTNCRARWRMKHKNTTDVQYQSISGNWRRYFTRLRQRAHRSSLTTEDLLAKLEAQNGRCALSGEEMTCVLRRGKPLPTNASIDRIQAGGSYAPDNIQLVCTVLNSFRNNQPVDEFIAWCRKVADYAEKT